MARQRDSPRTSQAKSPVRSFLKRGMFGLAAGFVFWLVVLAFTSRHTSYAKVLLLCCEIVGVVFGEVTGICKEALDRQYRNHIHHLD